MTKRLLVAGSAIAFGLMAFAPSAQAQFGVSAGISLPTGDFGDFAASGYSVNGLVGFSVPTVPVGFRAEVGYNAWDGKDNVDATFSTLSGTANILVKVPMTAARPYLIGGVGAYRTKQEGTFRVGGVLLNNVDVSETKFGFNIGGGLEFGLGLLTTMVEARWVNVPVDEGSDFSYVPITFGIMF